jgi:hypothetical protein
MARGACTFRQRDVTAAVKAALAEGIEIAGISIDTRTGQIGILPATSAAPRAAPTGAMEIVVKRRMSGDAAKEFTVEISLSKTGGGIYFAGFGNYVKIGRSGYVDGRIKELQTGSPEKIELYFVLAEDRIGEHDFHRKFSDLRLNGEWFRREGALADFIDHVQAGDRGEQIS